MQVGVRGITGEDRYEVIFEGYYSILNITRISLNQFYVLDFWRIFI
jgi:hypothetical protein